MDYMEARAILSDLPFLEVKPGLERINRLLELLGRPERDLPAIHIAGTNGKGSVAAMLSSILLSAGYRVGRFTSPELVDFRDRITVDGCWISEAAVAEAVELLFPALQSGDDAPTLFEALTAMAFSHFKARRVDVAVVEVGLGGRYDATNTLSPILTILTNVSRDHTHLLGESLREIAWEKAGIAKPGIPLLVGDLPPEARDVVIEECDKCRAPYVAGDRPGLSRLSFDWDKENYEVDSPDLPSKIGLPLLGGYQLENLGMVLRAVLVLRNMGYDLPSASVSDGLENARWPGRFEVVSRYPMIVLDGAHNLSAALALAKDIERYVTLRGDRHLVFGMLSDKEVEAVCGVLLPMFDDIILTRSSSPRALGLEPLTEAAKGFSEGFYVAPSVVEAMSVARARLNRGDTLFITGSLSIVRDARKVLVEAQCQV